MMIRSDEMKRRAGALGALVVGAVLMMAAGCTGDEDGIAARPTEAGDDAGVESPQGPSTPGQPPVDGGQPTEPEPEPEEEPEVPRCEGPSPPARCAADPASFEAYGQASLLSRVEVAGDEACCGDLDADGELDNALGAGFAAAHRLEPLNDDLQASLEDGSQAIVLELDGLDSLERDDELEVNVWRVRWDHFGQLQAGGLHPVLLDPASIDRGVAPLLSFESARVEDGVLYATAGAMSLTTTFYEFPLTVELVDVELTARLSGAAESDQGVSLREGRIAARVELTSLHGQLNVLAAGCECLGLEGPLVDPDPYARIGVCQKPSTEACAAAGRGECVGLVEYCAYIDAFAPNIADLDIDEDGEEDAISFGAFFEAERAVIEGVGQ